MFFHVSFVFSCSSHHPCLHHARLNMYVYISACRNHWINPLVDLVLLSKSLSEQTASRIDEFFQKGKEQQEFSSQNWTVLHHQSQCEFVFLVYLLYIYPSVSWACYLSASNVVFHTSVKRGQTCRRTSSCHPFDPIVLPSQVDSSVFFTPGFDSFLSLLVVWSFLNWSSPSCHRSSFTFFCLFYFTPNPTQRKSNYPVLFFLLTLTSWWWLILPDMFCLLFLLDVPVVSRSGNHRLSSHPLLLPGLSRFMASCNNSRPFLLVQVSRELSTDYEWCEETVCQTPWIRQLPCTRMCEIWKKRSIIVTQK
jgi:hypothetical protein